MKYDIVHEIIIIANITRFIFQYFIYQFINILSVRGQGFKGYHCSTTLGQTFGFSQDHLKDWKNPDISKDNSDVQCGITKDQAIDILKIFGITNF